MQGVSELGAAAARRGMIRQYLCLIPRATPFGDRILIGPGSDPSSKYMQAEMAKEASVEIRKYSSAQNTPHSHSHVSRLFDDHYKYIQHTVGFTIINHIRNHAFDKHLPKVHDPSQRLTKYLLKKCSAFFVMSVSIIRKPRNDRP